jgi:hypothetical protein
MRADPKLLGAALLLLSFAQSAKAAANRVEHQQNLNLTGGTCGNYLDVLVPNSAQSYTLRFKVEFAGDTQQARVYYTTDGSMPTGGFGISIGSTAVLTGAYSCTFFDLSQGQNVDVVTATIPAQPGGTIVKYVVSAWNVAGTPIEIFGNSGTCATCIACQNTACADLFQYTVLTATPTRTSTATATRTRTATATSTSTVTSTPSLTRTPTRTATTTPTVTVTTTVTLTPTITPTPSETPTRTRTFTSTITATATATRTPAPTAPPAINVPFFSTPPCRLIDTRLSGTALVAGETRSFPAAGQCGISATARAISINMTVTLPTVAGYLTAFPSGSDRPTTSTVNYSANQTRANNAVSLLGPAGDLAVFCGQASGTAHLIVDVNGYFE